MRMLASPTMLIGVTGAVSMFIGIIVLVIGTALKALQFIGVPADLVENERRRRIAWYMMIAGAVLVLAGLMLAYVYMARTTGVNLDWRDIVELIGDLALLALLGWEVYRALVKVRASRLAGGESPKLFLGMLSSLWRLAAAYLGKLLIEYKGAKLYSAPTDGIVAWILTTALVFLGLLYVYMRRREGTGDTPKNQDPR